MSNLKQFYIYESHLGGFYHTERKLTHAECYCDECGDSDWLLCTATKPQDIWDALEGEIDMPDGEGGWTGGWDKEYIENFIKEIPWEKLEKWVYRLNTNFHYLTMKKVKDINLRKKN